MVVLSILQVCFQGDEVWSEDELDFHTDDLDDELGNESRKQDAGSPDSQLTIPVARTPVSVH